MFVWWWFCEMDIMEVRRGFFGCCSTKGRHEMGSIVSRGEIL